jgi:hypothetical protein
LTILQPGFPLNGSVVLNTNNTITYTPQSGFQGVDTFFYLLQNSQGATANGKVTVTVQPSTLPPAATAISFDVSAAAGCSYGGEICAVCLDTHVTNPSNLVLTWSVSPTTPGGGNVSFISIGGCTNGVQYQSSMSSVLGDPDSFTFTVKDIYNRSSTGIASIVLN